MKAWIQLSSRVGRRGETSGRSVCEYDVFVTMVSFQRRWNKRKVRHGWELCVIRFSLVAVLRNVLGTEVWANLQPKTSSTKVALLYPSHSLTPHD